MLDTISKAYTSSPDNLIAEMSTSAFGEDMGLKAAKIKSFLRKKGFHVPEKTQGPLLSGINQRYAFQQAGLGYIGKNMSAICEKYGPRIFISTLLTNAPFIPNEPYRENLCGDCNICEKFCMSKAILGDGYFNQRQCESVANSKRQNMYYSLTGWHNCDICQRKCPRGTIKYAADECRGTWWDILERHSHAEIAKHSLVEG
jgi:epoxyqueuosine reductase QueG